MSSNFDVKVYEQKTNFNDYLGYTNNPNQTVNNQTTPVTPRGTLDILFSYLTQVMNGGGQFANTNNLSADPTRQQPIDPFKGFQFKDAKEQSAVQQAYQEMMQAQAANPGKPINKTIKVGKYKFNMSLKEDGTVDIKRKKKKKGLFGKIGGAFKKIGKVLKKALPIISTVAMFIPGLQPLALAARVATGVMGVVDGIKNGNVFGAITSAVGALSGVGGKVGSFVSNLSSKATGVLGNLTSGITNSAAGSWLSNAVNTGSNFISKGQSWLSNLTGTAGTKVSDFLFNKGSGVFNNLTNSVGGKFGNWFSQNGPGLFRNLTDSVGNRVTNWLNEKANNVVNRFVNSNPLTQRLTGALNSPWGQYLLNVFRSRQV